MENIFDFNNINGYIKTPKILHCKNKIDVNKFCNRRDISILIENYSYEIMVNSLLGRKFLLGNNNIDNGVINDKYKKIFLININDLCIGDFVYDIELVGNIYNVYIIIDDTIIMKVNNQFSNNLSIKIPEFNLYKPLPGGNLIISKIQIGIEMNNKYNEMNNEKIHINLKCGNYNVNNRMIIIQQPKFNIYMTECKNIGFNVWENFLMIFAGKCIPFFNKTLEYYI